MSERPPEAVLWDFLRGAMTTRALGAVVDAGIPERLADGPRSVSELSERPDTTHRLLRALASDGVFREEEPGVFAHTETSRLLLDPAWASFAHLFGGLFYESVTDLGAEDAPTFPRRFGTDFWSWLRDRPEERASFDTAMGGGKERRAKQLAELDWQPGEVVVDVGGGNGALLVALIRHRPELRGKVLDLSETARDEDALAAHGVEFVEGSFFETAPTADAYVLSQILHDWSDEDAARILCTIRAAAPPHSRLLVTEAVIPPGNDAHGSKWLDLLMLVLSGGRERGEQDWRDLLAATGFEPVSIEDGLIQARCI